MLYGFSYSNASSSHKESSFLDLNTEVIGDDIHNSVYRKRGDFDFLIINFPWFTEYNASF